MEERENVFTRDPEDYEDELSGQDPETEDKVYQPHEDTFLLCDACDELAKKDVLEVGCGSGFIAVELAKKGLKVDACDVNPYAVQETMALAAKENASVKAFESDLFESVTDTYDTIIFNPPYLPKDERQPHDEIDTATTGGERGFEVIKEFLEEAPAYLNDKGIMLLLFSSLSDKDKIDEIIKDLAMEHQTVRDKSIFFEKLYVYKISMKDNSR